MHFKTIVKQYLIHKFMAWSVMILSTSPKSSRMCEIFLVTSAAILLCTDIATTHYVKRSVAVSMYLQVCMWFAFYRIFYNNYHNSIRDASGLFVKWWLTQELHWSYTYCGPIRFMISMLNATFSAIGCITGSMVFILSLCWHWRHSSTLAHLLTSFIKIPQRYHKLF